MLRSKEAMQSISFASLFVRLCVTGISCGPMSVKIFQIGSFGGARKNRETFGSDPDHSRSWTWNFRGHCVADYCHSRYLIT